MGAVLGPQEPRAQDHDESQIYRVRSHRQAYSQRETLLLKDKGHLRAPGKKQGPVSSAGASLHLWIHTALGEHPRPLLFLPSRPQSPRMLAAGGEESSSV